MTDWLDRLTFEPTRTNDAPKPCERIDADDYLDLTDL